MGRYSIKELEKLSGIKAHTIRIWEKRYKIVEPKRTDTNIRYYSDNDLKKILNVSILNNHGYKISKIAGIPGSELAKKVIELSSETDEAGVFIDQLTVAMVDMDERRFEKLISGYILRFGFEKTILKIIYPFLEKIGVLWLSDNITPIQEHFMSNLIRQKIIVAIDGLNIVEGQDIPCYVFFLPENELHEIGLLFYHYIVRSRGFKTVYLGQYVPLKDLKYVVKSIKPEYLITSISHTLPTMETGEFITQLASSFPKIDLLMTGKPLQSINEDLPKNVKIFDSTQSLIALLS